MMFGQRRTRERAGVELALSHLDRWCQLSRCNTQRYFSTIREAALRFLEKAIRRHGVPETITIDGSDANEAAIKRYNEEHGTTIHIRQVKYLNNIVEQDHRAVKRITRSMLGFKAFDAAQDMLVGIELMHMLKKRQLMMEAGNEGLTAAEQFYSLAA
jgi:putative transposase